MTSTTTVDVTGMVVIAVEVPYKKIIASSANVSIPRHEECLLVCVDYIVWKHLEI